MKTTGNAITGFKGAALIIIMILLSGTFTNGQSDNKTAHFANKGFNLSGVSVSSVSAVPDYGFTDIEFEETLELESWMSDFGCSSVQSFDETVSEPELKVEDWMTDSSKWNKL
ncbi:MAG: hypothetical protein JXR41_04815 [Bacteroidales bacterium]|nr:hypothetical protein [Bacteroidales bacterium]MBN2762392.1 hypothetical protein [Bacteroidales bacterium]